MEGGLEGKSKLSGRPVRNHRKPSMTELLMAKMEDYDSVGGKEGTDLRNITEKFHGHDLVTG